MTQLIDSRAKTISASLWRSDQAMRVALAHPPRFAIRPPPQIESGNAWRTAYIASHGSRFSRARRAGTFVRLNCVGDFTFDSSAHDSGVATPAPGRARTP